MIAAISTPELTSAERAARAGGEILARYFREGVAMRSKGIANLVSDADIEAERAIVSVACYRSRVPQCGVVLNDACDEWHVAVRGKGAYPNGRPARVGEQARLDEVLIGGGFYYNRGALMDATLAAIGKLKRRGIHGIRRFGTASLDLCMVGLGMFGAYFELELSPWDLAAGRLFEEAGGRVTTCEGEPLPLARSSILASNGRLHDAVLRGVRNHLPPDRLAAE